MEDPRLLVQVSQLGLMMLQAGAQLAAPLGVLQLQGVKAGQQPFGGILGPGTAGPSGDVLVGGGLVAVLQLGDLGRGPSQQPRKLPAGQSGVVAKLAEPQAQRLACLLDAGHARSSSCSQTHPAGRPGARHHPASNCAAPPQQDRR